MESRTKKLNGILLTLLMALVTISVGYAALSTVLNINISSVTSKGSGDATDPVSWNVGFTGSSSPTVGGTSSTGRSCGAATVSATSVTVAATTLSKPGDSCTYPLTIKNSGTISAKVSSITPTKPTGTNVTCTVSSGTASASAQMVCGNITYKLAASANGNSPFVTQSTLDGGQSTTVYLIISYTGASLNSTQVTQSSGKFSVTYAQN